MTVDTKKLEQFLGQFVNDLGATVHAGMVVIGDRLGLYKALPAGPLTAAELAAITRTDERYVREWLLPGRPIAHEPACQIPEGHEHDRRVHEHSSRGRERPA